MYFKPAYILIILFTIVVDYIAGLFIEGASGLQRKLYLVISLLTNVGVLAFYKYFNFLAANFNSITTIFHGPQIPLLNLLLPIGLSFHTFQAMSYTIEVYRGRQPAERHFGLYALYVLFYPQMVAGPIERPQHILPQLRRTQTFNSTTFITGLLMMAGGFFKKVVVADRLGLYVDPVFSNPHGHSALDLLLATYFFSFQIYCDFSGYTDIAIGAALTLGIELMKNFNMPYISTNIAEFWSRWHISLSTWFRDYVYIPLGGNRVGFSRLCVNILLVFAISGLWHGAHWKYLIWGLIHGCLLITYHLFKKFKPPFANLPYLKWLITFNLVCLTWIFFRAETLNDAFFIFQRMLSFNGGYTAANLMSIREITYCILLIALLVWAEWTWRRSVEFSNFKKLTIITGLVVGVYLLGIFNEAQFIYFQF
jgi:D-alanyl-lipoteichoic acid acyltransferase DltB (MBOAT superfamily)